MTAADPGNLDAQIHPFGAMRQGSHQIEAAARNGGSLRVRHQSIDHAV